MRVHVWSDSKTSNFFGAVSTSYETRSTFITKCGCVVHKNKKGSLNAVTSYCINCVKETNAIRKREVKKLAINYLGGKCKVCGYNNCDAALEFHHLNPNEKDPDYNNLRSAFTDKLKIELDKCILVCANCHREIHNGLNIDTV